MVVNVPAVLSISFGTAARCLYEHLEYLDFYYLYIQDSAALGHEEQYIILFSLICLTVDYFKQSLSF